MTQIQPYQINYDSYFPYHMIGNGGGAGMFAARRQRSGASYIPTDDGYVTLWLDGARADLVTFNTPPDVNTAANRISGTNFTHTGGTTNYYNPDGYFYFTGSVGNINLVSSEANIYNNLAGSNPSFVLFIVCQPSNTAVNAALFAVAQSGGTDNLNSLMFSQHSSGSFYVQRRAAGSAEILIADGYNTSSSANYQIVEFSASNTTYNISVNNAFPSNGTITVGSISANRSSVACRADNISDNNYTGFIKEIILVSTLWGTDARNRTRNYLASKWGITLAVAPNYNYKLTTANSPVLLLNFNNNLLDSSGNGNDLDFISGTPSYTVLPRTNIPALRFNAGDTRLLRCITQSPSLLITGDITVHVLGSLDSGQTGFMFIHMATGETEATNIVYQIDVVFTSGTYRFHWFQESGAGVNREFTFTTNVNLYTNAMRLFSFRRVASTGIISLFIDGVLIEDSTSLVNATGGSDGYYYFGPNSGQPPMPGYYSSNAIYNAALSDGTIAAHYAAAFS